MPALKMVVKVWCLPKQTEEELKSFHQALVANLVKVDIGVRGENDVIVLFPTDMMAYGLGSEIHVEVSHFSGPPHMRYDILKRRIASSVMTVVKRRFPHAHVQGSFTPWEDFPNAD